MSLLQDLRERHVARYVVTYCAVGWIVLQLVDQVVDRSVLPEIVYRVFLTLFLCGLPGALIVSWFHGAKGRQTVPTVEKWLLAGVVVFALATTGMVLRSGLGLGEAGELVIPPEQDPSRVAVLYFDSRGGGEDLDLLASGLTEALIDDLNTVEPLYVVSRRGSALFEDSPASIDSIGRALEVGTIVDGSLVEAGGQIRLTVRMHDAFTGEELESTQIQRPREDLFALQDSLVAQVGFFLRPRIGAEMGDLVARAGTDVPEAWTLLQRAEEASDDGLDLATGGELAAAREAFDRADSILRLAREADPEWTEPLIRRAWIAYRKGRWAGLDRTELVPVLERGVEVAEQALAESPTNADALEVKATLQYLTYLYNLAGDPSERDRLFHEAEDGLRAAIAQNPDQASALTTLSHLLFAKGNVSQAKIMAQRSYEADPYLENANLTLWRLNQASFELEDELELRRHCDEGQARFGSDYRFWQCELMYFALAGGADDVPEAWEDFDRYVERMPASVRPLGEKRGLLYVAMGLARVAEEETRPALADSARSVVLRARASSNVDPVRELSLLEAAVRTELGDYDEAVEALGTYLAANPGVENAYREATTRQDLPWYLQDLFDQPVYRQLVGLE